MHITIFRNRLITILFETACRYTLCFNQSQILVYEKVSINLTTSKFQPLSFVVLINIFPSDKVFVLLLKKIKDYFKHHKQAWLNDLSIKK